jgi:hypothetical protein
VAYQARQVRAPVVMIQPGFVLGLLEAFRDVSAATPNHPMPIEDDDAPLGADRSAKSGADGTGLTQRRPLRAISLFSELLRATQ